MTGILLSTVAVIDPCHSATGQDQNAIESTEAGIERWQPEQLEYETSGSPRGCIGFLWLPFGPVCRVEWCSNHFRSVLRAPVMAGWHVRYFRLALVVRGL